MHRIHAPAKRPSHRVDGPFAFHCNKIDKSQINARAKVEMERVGTAVKVAAGAGSRFKISKKYVRMMHAVTQTWIPSVRWRGAGGGFTLSPPPAGKQRIPEPDRQREEEDIENRNSKKHGQGSPGTKEWNLQRQGAYLYPLSRLIYAHTVPAFGAVRWEQCLPDRLACSMQHAFASAPRGTRSRWTSLVACTREVPVANGCLYRGWILCPLAGMRTYTRYASTSFVPFLNAARHAWPGWLDPSPGGSYRFDSKNM
ncbi:hypothetical protein MAPG_02646 [Magnaporthiopsis poae ATCC 64411]|uniref:Uncharacterized protein n=1 Tax=Magnaporthiopsis poae (strain ATCC 64411 / 73-15) TaxID=644358 RepID=A0A0C4DRX8_MAGP6|nr:hypothetical protein MAPG_02646 [Magnaporthiopsis poae ATCC 64411]